MRTLIIGAVLAAGLACLLAAAPAQGADRVGAPAGGPGRFVLVQNADAPPPDGPMGPGPRLDLKKLQEQMQAARAAEVFRVLEDPLVRSEIGLSAEQEAKVVELHAKTKAVFDRIRDRVQPDSGLEEPGETLSPEEQEARRHEARRAWADAFHEARPELEAMMKEAADLLTDPQREKLKAIMEERGRLGWGTGDLWILTTSRIKQELALDDAQVQAIRDLLKESARKLTDLRQETFAVPPEGASPDRVQQIRQRIETFRQRQHQIADETRQSILSVLTPDQRAKAEARLKQREDKRKEDEERFGGGWMGEPPPPAPPAERDPGDAI
jgi:Spy/CpxP family protein refolding chaperone